MLPFGHTPRRSGTFGALEGGWSQSPELVDRMSMLPIGQYEDGSLTPAFPGIVSPGVEWGRNQFREGSNDDLLLGLPQLQGLISAAYDPLGTAKTAASGLYDFLLRPGVEGAVRSYEQGRHLPRVDEEGFYAGTPRAEPLDAFNAASIAPVGTLGARAAGLTRDVGDLGMFAGRGAKTADQAKLAQAERMSAEGAPREQIWNDTGWFQGVDGKWRFEIDDSKFSLAQGATAAQAYRHPQLHAAYPDFGNVGFGLKGKPDEGAHLPGFGGSQERVTIGQFSTAPESVAAHEAQHAIQAREGFAAGSSPRRAPLAKAEFSAEVQRLKDNPSDIPPWASHRLDAAMYNVYRRHAGEVEARNVQTRLGLSPEQRAARPPWLDYDVPESDQVVRFFANDSRSALPAIVTQGNGPLLLQGQEDDDISTSDILRRYGLLGP